MTFKSSDAQRKAVAKYQSEKVENITVRVPKGRKDYYKGAASAQGMSLNAFAVACLDYIIDNGVTLPPEGNMSEQES